MAPPDLSGLRWGPDKVEVVKPSQICLRPLLILPTQGCIWVKVEVSVDPPELLSWLPLILLWSGWVPLWFPTIEEVETFVNLLKIFLQLTLVSAVLKSGEQQAPNHSLRSVSPPEILQ